MLASIGEHGEELPHLVWFGFTPAFLQIQVFGTVTVRENPVTSAGTLMFEAERHAGMPRVRVRPLVGGRS